MAEHKNIVDLLASSAVEATDLFYTIKDPDGTPLDRKATGTQLAAFMTAALVSVFQPLSANLTALAAVPATAAGRTVLTIPDPSADRLVAWDNSENKLSAMASADIATEATPTVGDYILIYTSEGTLAKTNWGNLPAPGGLPGGSDTQVQFNDGGSAFGGDAGLTYDKTTNLLTLIGTDGASSLLIASGSQTGASSPALSITQTWDNAGTTFTGLLANFTNTASATGSLFFDIQLGGSTVLKMTRIGQLTVTARGAGSTGTPLSLVTDDGVTTATAISFGNLSGQTGQFSNSYASGPYNFIVNAKGSSVQPIFLIGYSSGNVPVIELPDTGILGWSDPGFAGTGVVNAIYSADLQLFRDAAGVLAQRTGTNAQTFRIYNTYTNSSNYERGFLQWSSNVLQIGAEANGTGTLRPMQFLAARSYKFGITGNREQAVIDDDTYDARFGNSTSGGHVWFVTRGTGNVYLGGPGVVLTSGIGDPPNSDTIIAFRHNADQVGHVCDHNGVARRGFGLHSYLYDMYIASGGRPTIDEVKYDLWITGAQAAPAATTNLTGGNLRLHAGRGASGSAGNAHGGNIYLTPGKGYGTGHDGSVIIAGGTVTQSSPLLTLTQTWDNSGVAFTGMLINITATQYYGLSSLFQVQRSGSPIFAIESSNSAGNEVVAKITGTTGQAPRIQVGLVADTYNRINFGLDTADNPHLSFGPGGAGQRDTFLTRDAAGIFAQRNSTNPQGFCIYNTYTDGSNYERASLGWDANVFEISPQKAGTGAMRTIRFFGNDDQVNYGWCVLTSSGYQFSMKCPYPLNGRFINDTDDSGWDFLTVNKGIGRIDWRGVLINSSSQVAPQALFGYDTQDPAYDVAQGTLRVRGRPAAYGATTNLVGGEVIIQGGAGAQNSAGAAHGGNVTLTPGVGYGTGHNGYVILSYLPTSATGLPTGALWNNSGVINVA